MKFLLGSRPTYFFLLITIILLICYFFVKNTWFMSDELSYYHSIHEIARGTIGNQTFTRFSVLPGYVFIYGMIIRLFGLSYANERVLIPVLRGISAFFAFFTIYLFFLLAKKIQKEDAYIKTMQFLLSPIIFPFFFLIYTDIFSLLLNLISFYYVLDKKYMRSGIISFFSIFIRQDNIFWIIFYCIYIFFDIKTYTLQKKTFMSYLKNIAMYSLGFISLGVLMIFNKGNVAIGYNAAHPVSFHMGNVYFFVISLFLLFLPFHIFNTLKIIDFIQKKPIITLLISVILLPVFSFHVDHPNNQLGKYFLHNGLLHLLVVNTTSRIITYLILVWTILSFAVTQFHKKIYYNIYPCIFLSLSAAWLIEPRYYFVPITFFMLFKKEASVFITRTTFVYYAILTTVITTGTIMGGFFL